MLANRWIGRLGGGSINSVAGECCHEESFRIEHTHSEVCYRDVLALLIYDMQIGIAGQIKTAETVIANVGRVLNAARDARVRVFFTRHMSLPLALMGAFQLRMAMAWQGVDEPSLVQPAFLCVIRPAFRSSRS